MDRSLVDAAAVSCITPVGANSHAEELLRVPPRRTGQRVTGHNSQRVTGHNSVAAKISARDRPVTIPSGGVHMVVLDSAGQLGRLQTSRR
jgi:hypothetical protein